MLFILYQEWERKAGRSRVRNPVIETTSLLLHISYHDEE